METPLETARRHVVQGERIVTRMEGIVDELRGGGHDTTVAEELLSSTRGLLIEMRRDLARQTDSHSIVEGVPPPE